jgi:hypothetical protein
MKATTLLAIIFGPLIVGALVPVVFGKTIRGSLSEESVCDFLADATKRGFLTVESKKRLFEETLKSLGLDATARSVFESASKQKAC